jgi:EAL domain-containing protein (putative c-di-GMP-specific phosphodiesterase class I)
MQRLAATPAPQLNASGSHAPDMTLDRVLSEQAIFPLFQPIVDLRDRSIVAVEALARGPAGSTLEFPDALFAAANAQDRLTELDQLCCQRALTIARDTETPVPPLVFVNAEPAGLTRPMSAELEAVVHGGLPFTIVLEFTERALGAASAPLMRVTEMVQDLGNAVALDDVGADPLSLAFLPLIDPAVVKLDMQLLRSPYSAQTMAVTAAVAAFAERGNAIVLAEGIETEQDAVNAVALGATWGQGWLFGRPGSLTALAERRMDHTASLPHKPGPRPKAPTDTPFSVAARHGRVRRAEPPMMEAVIDHVFVAIGADRSHGVVTCVLSRTDDLSVWLPRLRSLSATAGYVGLVAPSAVPSVPAVHTFVAGPDDPLSAETVVAFVGQHLTTALCIRRTDEGFDFVVTADRDVAQMVTRMVLKRSMTW